LFWMMPEVVAVVVYVGRKLGLVAPPDERCLLLAGAFQYTSSSQLVGLDEPRGIGEPLAERPEEERKP